MQVVRVEDLKKSKLVATKKLTLVIEDFKGEWKKEWFSYNKDKWGIKTHKIYDPIWEAPEGAKLYFEVKAEMSNKMIVGLDNYAAEVSLQGKNEWQGVKLSISDFKNFELESARNWQGVKQLRLDDSERQRSKKGSTLKSKVLGAKWKGPPPEFRYLRWLSE
jgi:hypothetical protein